MEDIRGTACRVIAGHRYTRYLARQIGCAATEGGAAFSQGFVGIGKV